MTGSVPAQTYVGEAPPTSAPSGPARLAGVARAVVGLLHLGRRHRRRHQHAADARRSCLHGTEGALRPHAVHRRHLLGDGDAGQRRPAAREVADARRDRGSRTAATCDESDAFKCSDDWGEAVHAAEPTETGSRSVRFSDAASSSRKAGAPPFPWDPDRCDRDPDPVRRRRGRPTISGSTTCISYARPR